MAIDPEVQAQLNEIRQIVTANALQAQQSSAQAQATAQQALVAGSQGLAYAVAPGQPGLAPAAFATSGGLQFAPVPNVQGNPNIMVSGQTLVVSNSGAVIQPVYNQTITPGQAYLASFDVDTLDGSGAVYFGRVSAFDANRTVLLDGTLPAVQIEIQQGFTTFTVGTVGTTVDYELPKGTVYARAAIGITNTDGSSSLRYLNLVPILG